MQIQEIMTRNVDIADPKMAISDVARKMRDENIGSLPVGENDRLIGVVTDRDIVVRGVAEEKAAGTTSVRDVMSEGVFYCFEDEDTQKAAEVMAEHQVHRLPILNRDKRLVGIIALADLGRSEGGPTQRAISGISQPTQQARR